MNRDVEHGGRAGPGERAVQEERRSEAAFRRLADAMPHLVWLAEPKGPIGWFNRRWFEYTGLDAERSAGWGWRRARHPAEGDVVEKVRARVQAGEVWEETASLRGRDGRYRRFLSRSVPVRDDEGRLVRWVGSATDIEDQLQAQEEERKLSAERAQVLALLDTVIDTAPVGLAFFDASIRWVRVNRVLAEINDRPVAEHLGRTLREVRPDIADLVERDLRAVFDTGQPVPAREVFDASPGTEPAHRLVSFFPVKDARGRVFLAVAVVVDISAQKRTEEALQRTAEFRERFLGVVAHDLRNPLAAISSGAQLLQRLPDLPERGLRLAGQIRSATARMGNMIAQLMDFTRVRLGAGMSLERAPVDLLATLRQLVDEVQIAAPGRAIRVDAEGDLRGEWDANRLVQVASNLVKNALDYSPEESEVEVSLRREGDVVRLEVKNENLGEPIPPAQLEGVFDPFRQAPDGRRKREGLGLGLYIAREIVTAHGGTIAAASGAEGTTFTVRLPVAPPVVG